MTKEKIIDKVQKLRAKAENAKEIGSIAEAELFASKMQELMLKNQLSMTDLEFKNSLEEDIIHHRVDWNTHGFKKKYSRCKWIEDLAYIVSRTNGCSYLVHTGSNMITIVGHESKVEIAEYTLAVLVKAAHKMAHAERGKEYKALKEAGLETKNPGFISSWLKGFIEVIWDRFKAQEDQYRNDAGKAGALVRVDKSYSEVCKHIKEDKAIGTARSCQSLRKSDLNAYEKGRQAGKDLQLNKGVSGSTSAKGQLR